MFGVRRLNLCNFILFLRIFIGKTDKCSAISNRRMNHAFKCNWLYSFEIVNCIGKYHSVKKILLFSISFLTFVCAHTQVTTFAKAFDIWNEGAMNNFQQTSDGGYILSSDAMPEQDTAASQLGYGYLIKMDPSGNTQWEKKYRKTNDFIKSEDGDCVFQTKDGGYIIGTDWYTITNSIYGQNSSIYLIKTDGSGNFLWSKTYPGIGTSSTNCIKQTADFGYIVCGSTTDTINDLTKTYLLKTDIAGNVQWGKTYEESASGQSGDAYCVNQTSDGGYVVCGESFSGAFIMKTDGSGNIVWNNNLGVSGSDILYSAQQTSDGGYIACGCGAPSSSSFQLGTTLLKFDGNGNSIWQKGYNSSPNNSIGWGAFSVLEVPGGYTVLNEVVALSISQSGLMKTDASGNVLWANFFLKYSAMSSALAKTTDGGYAFTSRYWANNFTSGGSLAVKTDSLGWTSCNDSILTIIDCVYSPVINPGFVVASVAPSYTINTVFYNVSVYDSTLCPNINEDAIATFSSENSISIFPNPTSGIVSVQLNSASGVKIQLDVFDVLGEKVYSSFENSPLNNSPMTIDLSSLSDGIYFVQVKTDGKIIATKKIVKEN